MKSIRLFMVLVLSLVIFTATGTAKAATEDLTFEGVGESFCSFTRSKSTSDIWCGADWIYASTARYVATDGGWTFENGKGKKEEAWTALVYHAEAEVTENYHYADHRTVGSHSAGMRKIGGDYWYDMTEDHCYVSRMALRADSLTKHQLEMVVSSLLGVQRSAEEYTAVSYLDSQTLKKELGKFSPREATILITRISEAIIENSQPGDNPPVVIFSSQRAQATLVIVRQGKVLKTLQISCDPIAH